MKKIYSILESWKLFDFKNIDEEKIPQKWIYIIFDISEKNEYSKKWRIVRVWTHWLKNNSNSNLLNRLKKHIKHKGSSIFIKHIWRAIIKDKWYSDKIMDYWNKKWNIKGANMTQLEEIERKSVDYIKQLKFICIDIDKSVYRKEYEWKIIWYINWKDNISKKWLWRKHPKPSLAKSWLWVVQWLKNKKGLNSKDFDFIEKNLVK